MEPVKSADRDIPLIADANALADYLQGGPTAANGAKSRGDVPTLKQWLALGEDTTEAQYKLAYSLGLPLVRLADIEPTSEANALIRPEVARRLRAVPLRVHQGMVAVALEDPGNGKIGRASCRERV